MAYPYSNLYGDISVTVAFNSVIIPMDVSAGLPVLDQLADILIRHQITKPNTINANGQIAYKLQKGATDLDNGKTFAQQGVHDGDALTIATV